MPSHMPEAAFEMRSPRPLTNPTTASNAVKIPTLTSLALSHRACSLSITQPTAVVAMFHCVTKYVPSHEASVSRTGITYRSTLSHSHWNTSISPDTIVTAALKWNTK